MTTKYYLKEKCSCWEQIKIFPKLKQKDCPLCKGKGFTREADITELMNKWIFNSVVPKYISDNEKKSIIQNIENDFRDLIEVVEE